MPWSDTLFWKEKVSKRTFMRAELIAVPGFLPGDESVFLWEIRIGVSL